MEATLGNSSRVSVSASNIAAYQGPMTQRKRRELREAHIIAYIKSRPAGARIKTEEFRSIANMSSEANTNQLLTRMVRDKIITKDPITPRTFSYTVVNDTDVRVIKGPDPKKVKYNIGEIEELARQFSWSHEFSHNDLRKFIESLKKEQQHGRKETPQQIGSETPGSDEQSSADQEDISGAGNRAE